MEARVKRVSRCVGVSLAVLVLACMQASSTVVHAADDEKGKKPSLTLKVSPNLTTAPALVRATLDLRGGGDDFEEFYCPTVEWEWGDDTTSEASQDCPPFEAGRTPITRRFTAQHTYRQSGQYKVTVRLKRRDRALAMAVSNLQVQPGLGER